ncbi:hypothetical protein [Streptomyces sp. NPDC047042]|uniref:hypothetical protein n=1 Tax=Streptomyces sp. NPDC047042 TaxID=3154807 RepID=UPI0033CA2E0F
MAITCTDVGEGLRRIVEAPDVWVAEVDSIDDIDRLWCGDMPQPFSGVRTTAVLGSFPRSAATDA